MKIIFAADTSFNYFGDNYPGDEAAISAMSEVRKCFDRADFSVINLETTLGNRENYTPIRKSGPNQISLPEFKKYIEVLSPDAAGLANNHTGDFGEEPIPDTIEMLRLMGVRSFGAGANIDEAYKSVKFEKDGEKIAVIAVCENEFGVATEKKAGSAGYSLGRTTAAIQSAVAEGYKAVIFFHGGNEHDPFPAPSKKELYRHFVDIGACAVVAMHTHCPQGYEFYRGAPIIYSMGNFYFPAPPYPTGPRFKVWSQGYMTLLTFDGESVSFEAIPYKQDFDGVSLLEGEELAHFNKYLDAICAPIQNDELLQKYFDAWCFTRTPVASLAAQHERKNISAVKNLLWCEAHNDVLKAGAMLDFTEDTEELAEMSQEIKALQEMIIPKRLEK